MDQWDQVDRAERAAQGRRAAERLATASVVGVALTWVDTGGIARVKAVPTAALARAAAWGVGATPVFDFFLPDDSITTGRYSGGPTGDLLLLPDLARLVPLAAQPGWAWAPVDRWTQEGDRHPQCSRALVARLTERLGAAGLTAWLAFEVEWVLDAGSGDEVVPAMVGPAYGMTRLIAGILSRLPALLAIGAPSVASYQRLVPSHWAGVFGCWGQENREAAVPEAANVEVKCVDATANPYLLVAALLACGMAGIEHGATLPEPVDVDPASWSDDELAARGVTRLPQRLDDAVAAFVVDPVLAEAFGPELADTVVAVRRAEIERFASAGPEEIVRASRWAH
ncbi:MAG: glutamine synthetase [Pseudonocardiaceae bacterium]